MTKGEIVNSCSGKLHHIIAIIYKKTDDIGVNDESFNCFS